MFLNNQLKNRLKSQGAEFVHFVNISNLPEIQTKGFPAAILFGTSLSASFLRKITHNPNYVETMVRENRIAKDEFNLKEILTDNLADTTAKFLIKNGHAAFSQSEKNLSANECYNEKKKITPLPHKTIAGLAGMGWIGKHNLLVTQNYGSAISMCTVLTDAPLKTILFNFAKPECGNCSICQNVCPVQAIHGNSWTKSTFRDDMVDVFKCTTCLRCLVMCPFTQQYMKNQTIDSFRL